MEKTHYNELIKSARKLKGITQQELADKAGISLRTVQRIEKGTEEISGFSLKQISNILEIPLEGLIMSNVNQLSIDENQTGSIKALYIASLLYIINPLLGILVPAIMGYTKQNKNDVYKKNLKIIITIHGVGLIILGAIILLIITGGLTSIAPEFFNSRESIYIFLFPVIYYIAIFIITFFYYYSSYKNKRTNLPL